MATTYKKIVLKEGRERSLINRHPWLFSGGVAVDTGVENGDIVRVESRDGITLAYAHYTPDAPIRARVFEFSADADLEFNNSYWLNKLEAAWAHRQRYLDLKTTSGFRLINAEGDHLPGLVVDVYKDVAVVQSRAAGMRQWLKTLEEWLQKELKVKHILFKGEEEGGGTSSASWHTGGLEQVTFMENGFQFIAEPVKGQKTGFFLDQRDARALVGKLAHGRRVLNAFSYSGGFGVYALAGGAELVDDVDSSADACRLADENVALNNLPTAKHRTFANDCFDYLRSMDRDQYDLIVLDPPAFTKHIRTVDKAARGYKDINLRAMKHIAPGGVLATFSCSQHIDRELFRKIVYSAASDSGRSARLLYQTGHPVDHMVDIYHPEGEYLKGLFLRID